MTPETYSQALTKSIGREAAFKLAEKCFKQTAKENWADIPDGLYRIKNKSSRLVLDETYLANLHLWWKHVFFILKKSR